MFYTFITDIRKGRVERSAPTRLVEVDPRRPKLCPNAKLSAIKVGSLSANRIQEKLGKEVNREAASKEAFEYREFWCKYPDLVKTILGTNRLLTDEELFVLTDKDMLPFQILDDQLNEAEVRKAADVGTPKDIKKERVSATIPDSPSPQLPVTPSSRLFPQLQTHPRHLYFLGRHGKQQRWTPPSPYSYQVPPTHPRMIRDQSAVTFPPPGNIGPVRQPAHVGVQALGRAPRRHYFLPGNRASKLALRTYPHTVRLLNGSIQKDDLVQVDRVTEGTTGCPLDSIPENMARGQYQTR